VSALARLLALTLLLPLTGAEAASRIYLADRVAEEAPEAPLRAQAGELVGIFEDLKRVSGVDAILLYSTDPAVNAFATESEGKKLVLVQAGLLDDFEHDRDAVAAVLGHELAHHKADHIKAGHRKQQNVRVLGAVLGAVVGAKVGQDSGVLAGAASNVAVGAGAHLLALKFSRNQELEADRLAVGWMIEAGYNPEGMLRVQQHLQNLAGKQRSAAILSTHPTSAKRYQAAQKRIATLNPPAELLALEQRPMVDADALAGAERAIASAVEERIAAGLRARYPQPPEAAMAPVDGIDLDTWAALSHRLFVVGEPGKAGVLKAHGLDEGRLALLNREYRMRIATYPGLRERYDASFYRDAEGRYADWGRDLARSHAESAALQLPPPLPLETLLELERERFALGGAAMNQEQLTRFESDVLAAQGMRFYDYVIGLNWWVRKGEMAAMGGDDAINRALRAAGSGRAPDSGGSSVRIGQNVQIGGNVKIGGGERATRGD